MEPFNMPKLLVALLIALAAIADASAQSPKIYRCVDAKGKTFVTQTPPRNALEKRRRNSQPRAGSSGKTRF